MQIKPLEQDGTFLGWECQLPGSYFFFGGCNINRDNIADYFPQFRFAFLKQVHGSHIVKGNHSQVQEADGHWTTDPHLALCIQTADCLPVLFTNGQMVAAVHAGWRGLVAEIIPKTWDLCSRESPAQQSWAVAVGPHIQKESFEVGRDVAKEIEASHRKQPNSGAIDLDQQLIHPHPDSNKAYIDLSCLAQSQIHNTKADLSQVHIVREDTFHSDRCHSYRRDHKNAGRQISFAVLTKDRS